MTGSIQRERSGRERLQRVLVTLSRSGRSRRPGAERTPPGRAPAAPAPRIPWTPPAAPPSGPVSLPAGLEELVERLDRIADRLSELQSTGRALPATRELFFEWVRLRGWEEIAFSDFLKLRRAGRI